MITETADPCQELRDYLREMDRLQLAAHETGHADAWQFNHDQAAAELAALERQN